MVWPRHRILGRLKANKVVSDRWRPWSEGSAANLTHGRIVATAGSAAMTAAGDDELPVETAEQASRAALPARHAHAISPL